MKRRCLDPARPDFQYYGALGIQVCPQWLAKSGGFAQFLKDMGPRPEGHTLNRIYSYGHYEPENCEWVETSINCSQTKRNNNFRPEDYAPPDEDTLFQVVPKWPELLVRVGKFELLDDRNEEEWPF